MYLHSRESAIALLQAYATSDGSVRLSFVTEVFLEPAISDAEVAHVYRVARRVGVLSEEMALDPRTAQILALDT